MTTLRDLAAEYSVETPEIAATLDLGADYSETAEIPADVEAEYRAILDVASDLADAVTATDQAARLADLAGQVSAAKADLRAAVIQARAARMTEVDIAAATGLSRSTVRAWLGKG